MAVVETARLFSCSAVVADEPSPPSCSSFSTPVGHRSSIWGGRELAPLCPGLQFQLFPGLDGFEFAFFRLFDLLSAFLECNGLTFLFGEELGLFERGVS